MTDLGDLVRFSAAWVVHNKLPLLGESDTDRIQPRSGVPIPERRGHFRFGVMAATWCYGI
jgi:hypothetical protein